jgi:predicted PurR-regulated permease PerM
METIILITVLSTLGVVALVTTIAVAFTRLNNKVDKNTFDQEVTHLHYHIEKLNDNVNVRITDDITDVYNNMNRIESLIDSRCDKLYTEINNNKQLLKG